MGLEKLTSKEKKGYLKKMDRILVSKKLFLQNDFSLPDLAKETGIKLHLISYLLNSEINLRFTDYINSKRIDYFKGKIKDADWKESTAEEMILASGFKCRTTGYRAFKRQLGITPSEYLKSYKIQMRREPNKQSLKLDTAGNVN